MLDIKLWRLIRMRKVVTAFLRHGDKILVLRRSDRVGSYQGCWAGISGYIEEDETPLEAAEREIREETRIMDAKLVREGKPLVVEDKGIEWVVHPFLFDSSTAEVTLDWEHQGYRWIRAKELRKLRTVPGLKEALERCLGGL
jgi:8-oxo-dGTP pyrophosphatase MutT (NUDIX family)